MRDQKRSLSAWIWRRFGSSYRTAPAPGSTTGPQYGWTNTGSVGLALPWQQVVSTPVLSSNSWIARINPGLGNQLQSDEIGINAGSALKSSQYFSTPLAGRRIAVKRIAGSVDVFPTAVTMEGGDALYAHLAICRGKWQQNNFTTPVELVPGQTNIFDLEGNPPVYYRKHCWYYGGFTGSITSSYKSFRVNVLFKRPLVLDMEDTLDLNLAADVQLSAPGLGIYFLSYLPYLSFLCKVL